MPSDSRPLIVYFGSVQRPECYAGLLGADVALGLLKDTGSVHSLEPEEFDVIGRVPFSAGAEAVCRHLKELAHGRDLESVINVDEALVEMWAEVCARLGLPSMSRTAAATVRSKSLMRRRFAEDVGAHVSCRSRSVRGEAQALRFAADVGYPVVVKPENLWGSYFVSRCDDADALLRAYRDIRVAGPRFAAAQCVDAPPVDVLVEEFLPGTNHSVECLALGDRVWTTPVVDVVTGADLGGHDFHHFARVTASRLTGQEQRHLRELAADAVRAVGIDRGIAHAEFVHGPEGPKLIEVGGRPGGNRISLIHAAHGIDLLAGYRDVLRDREPAVTPSREGAAAVVTPYPVRPGILTAYHGLDEIRALSSVVQVDLHKHPGDSVRPRKDGALIPLHIALYADGPEQLWADLQEVRLLCESLFQVVPEAAPEEHAHMSDRTPRPATGT
ncbi:ATP-grasp domain-containing protein [Streptomyces sp. NPDC021093]|uniref:ATP-grasp domain-containing protein n=1 Tax=Streptomyces sp. NPDC021093 TaxID=3365112 RepID=UPI0037BAB1E5